MRKLVFCLVACLLILALPFAAEIFPNRAKNRIYHHKIAANAQYCGSAEQSAQQVNSDGTLVTGRFCSHLPVVTIETGGKTIAGDQEVVVSLSIIDNKGGHNHLESPPALMTDTLIKIRGNSSSRFDKKQYRLTFVSNESAEIHRALPVMGMPADSEWVINGPFLDKTMMRNYMMYNVAGELMTWSPNVRYCELFMDGLYRGVYLMIEPVKVSKNRVNIEKAVTGRPITGYLVNRERIMDTNYALHNFGTYAGKTTNELGIAYPGTKDRTEDNAEYVRQDISKFEKALHSLDYDTPTRSYKEYIDVQSFVDYYILNEFALNIDSGGLSTYAHKNLRGKLIMGPVWDFNNSFDNYEYYTLPIDEFYMVDKSWYVMLFRDGEFVEQVIARYHLLRKGILREDRLFAILDETMAFLGPAIKRNDTVWGYSYQDGWLDNFDIKLKELPYDRNPRDYQHAVEQLKAKMAERGRFLDQHIHVLRQFSAESAVKEWN